MAKLFKGDNRVRFLRSIKCFELKEADPSKEDIFSLSGKGFQISINKKLIKKNSLNDLKSQLDILLKTDKN